MKFTRIVQFVVPMILAACASTPELPYSKVSLVKDGTIQEITRAVESNDDMLVARQPLTGANLLHVAAAHGRADVVEYLLAKGMNIEAKDELGSSPLSLAVQHRQPDVVRLLLRKGADARSVNTLGRTPLSQAATFKDAPNMAAVIAVFGEFNLKPEL